MESSFDAEEFLAGVLLEFACETGTIHRCAAGNPAQLELVASAGVPDYLIEKISNIPLGKGIAGVAAERREAVELCNLQVDLGGIAKENARGTGVAGSLAVPVFYPATRHVIGTLGIGKAVPYQFSAEEKQQLARHSENLAAFFVMN